MSVTVQDYPPDSDPEDDDDDFEREDEDEEDEEEEDEDEEEEETWWVEPAAGHPLHGLRTTLAPPA